MEIKKNLPDLVLLDVLMPGTNGYDLCAQIHEEKNLSNLPVIFVTGRTAEASELKGFEMGITDYIKKPVKKEILLRRVRRALGL